jgi:thiosulfate/3-mercaptopyruvate sulfurtransferase
MALRTLVDVDTLAAHLDDPRWVVLDCRFELTRPTWGEEGFAVGHIPGAQYAHLDRDLASAPTSTSGRHPLPVPETFAALARRWGINTDTQIVVHDQASGVYAARAWWLFRWLGHESVAVLRGGLAAWTANGRSLTTATASRATGNFVARPQTNWTVTVDDVLDSVESHRLHVVDGRGADRFAGQNETMDPIAGHVPGAVNHPFASNFAADGTWLPEAELRARWEKTLQGRPANEVVTMCGSGVSACLNLLALETLGIQGARLYTGSWSEWVRDPSRPVATGASAS